MAQRRRTTRGAIPALALALGLAGLGACGGDDARPTDGAGAQDAGRSPDAGVVASDAATSPDADRPPGDGGRLDAGSTDPSDGGGGSIATSPDAPGRYPVTEVSGTIPGGTTSAFVPTLPAGVRAPLVLFKHGFQLATSNYGVGLERLASHGFVVVGVDTGGGVLGGPTNAEERDAVIAALDWALGDAPFAGSVEPTLVGVAGHSRGGKVATMVAAAEGRVDATLLLDPVNGCGPGSDFSAHCPDITSAAIGGGIGHPIGVMGETTNATGGFMPCAPADQNYETVYAALSAPPSWKAKWTFTGADHMDFTDDGGGFSGSLCTDGPGDDAQIRDAWHALMVAFFRRHLNGEASMSDWLAGASLPSGIEAVTAP